MQDWYGEETATFGDRLAAAREGAGLNQQQVAERLGVKPATIAAWEEDLKEPRANRLSILAGMLGVSLSWLMTGQGEGPDGSDTDAAIPANVHAILAEIRAVRSEIAQSGERLARLEKRLRKALSGEGGDVG